MLNVNREVAYPSADGMQRLSGHLVRISKGIATVRARNGKEVQVDLQYVENKGLRPRAWAHEVIDAMDMKQLCWLVSFLYQKGE